jgi:hypothetical protein
MANGQKTIANTSVAILLIVFSVILGFDAGKGNDSRFGVISTLSSVVGSIPNTVKKLLAPYPDYVFPASEIVALNTLKEDVYALHTFGPENQAILVNLRNDEVIKTWNLGEHKPYPNARYFAQMLPDSSLFVYVHEGDWMGRIDADGSLLWERSAELIYHHSAERLDEHIWICARDVEYLHDYGKITLDTVMLNNKVGYGVMDEVMLEVDLATGATTDSISMLELFAANDLNPIFKSFYGPASGDCFHLNDIQPVTFTDTLNDYLPGDLLVSNRTQNELLHVRPSTLEILHYFNEGLSSQHDVDLLGDSLVVCFNNNSPSLFAGEIAVDAPEHMGTYSHTAAFDLSGNAVNIDLKDYMLREHIYTTTEGLQQHLENGLVAVEAQNRFCIYIFDGETLVYRDGLNYFGSEEYVEIPNWTRFYTN